MLLRPIQPLCILCRRVIEDGEEEEEESGIVCSSEQWLISREVWSQASDENSRPPPRSFLTPPPSSRLPLPITAREELNREEDERKVV